ncbi:30S ribosomal protein S4 [Candidatus Woesearchaeota archaeon]|nr:30S ribosomal protein S4 [Candidatus Woesearchaeota archaeon]
MGSPRKPRKKYETPEHPWRKERIEAEKILLEWYGLKNKKEIYKMESRLRSFFRQARSLISSTSDQSKKEERQLLEKLYKYNLIQDKNTKVENVLNLKLKDIMERRLQTLVHKAGLAKTIKQARQFIVHGHVFVDGKKISVPSYLVSRNEENKITFDQFSTLSNHEHPERIKIVQVKKPLVEETKLNGAAKEAHQEKETKKVEKKSMKKPKIKESS